MKLFKINKDLLKWHAKSYLINVRGRSNDFKVDSCKGCILMVERTYYGAWSVLGEAKATIKFNILFTKH